MRSINNNFVPTAVLIFAIFHFNTSLRSQKYQIVRCRSSYQLTTVCQVLRENEPQANNHFYRCTQSDLSQNLDNILVEPYSSFL